MAVQQVVLATRNAHKLAELQRILVDCGVEVELVPPADDVPEVAETESTFADNALLKARAVSAHSGLPAIADDSGLCVDALNGMPGVLSARWSGVHGDDLANLTLLLDQIADVPLSRRGAQFVCAAALVVPDAESGVAIERVVEGAVEGHLISNPLGTNGFGYDPVFVPDGYDLTTAQMQPADKDAISHRGKALQALAPILAELLAAPEH